MNVRSSPDAAHPWTRLQITLTAILGLACATVCSLAALFTWVAAPFFQSIGYPGGEQVSEDAKTEWLPLPSIQRSAVYRTADEFPSVYIYYSQQFSLGPERYANGNCNLMARTFTTAFVIEQSTSVTLCETPKDRMVIIYRTVTLRLPR